MALPSVLALSATLMCNSVSASLPSTAHYQETRDLSSMQNSENLQYRVAFDLGSGKLKMQAAKVDTTKGRVIEIVRTQEVLIPLRDGIDTDPHRRIPEKIVEQLKAALRDLMREAATYGPVSGYAGTATEAFRVASNGMEVLESISRDLGISLSRLTPDEEGILGYRALEAEGHFTEGMLPITLETGGGSTQILIKGERGFQFYNLSFGRNVVKNYIVKHIQKRELSQAGISPNPISKQQAQETVAWIRSQLAETPSWIRETLSQDNSEVIARGAGFATLCSGLGKMEFSKDEVWQLILERLEKTDEELGEIDPVFLSKNRGEVIYMLSDLLYIYGVMDALGFERIRSPSMKGPGSTSAVLTDEQKWRQSTSRKNALSRVGRVLGHLRV